MPPALWAAHTPKQVVCNRTVLVCWCGGCRFVLCASPPPHAEYEVGTAADGTIGMEGGLCTSGQAGSGSVRALTLVDSRACVSLIPFTTRKAYRANSLRCPTCAVPASFCLSNRTMWYGPCFRRGYCAVQPMTFPRKCCSETVRRLPMQACIRLVALLGVRLLCGRHCFPFLFFPVPLAPRHFPSSISRGRVRYAFARRSCSVRVGFLGRGIAGSRPLACSRRDVGVTLACTCPCDPLAVRPPSPAVGPGPAGAVAPPPADNAQTIQYRAPADDQTIHYGGGDETKEEDPDATMEEGAAAAAGAVFWLPCVSCCMGFPALAPGAAFSFPLCPALLCARACMYVRVPAA
jgi:hypothetical protein